MVGSRLLWTVSLAVCTQALIIGLDMDSVSYRMAVFEASPELKEVKKDRVERSTCLIIAHENRTFDVAPRSYKDYLEGHMACGYFPVLRSTSPTVYVPALEAWNVTNEGLGISLNSHFWLSEELLAMQIDHIHHFLEAKYPNKTLEFGLSIPSHWTYSQRLSIQQIAALANVTLVGTIDKIAAAVLNYGHNRHSSHAPLHYALFFHLGKDQMEIAVGKFTGRQENNKEYENIEVVSRISTQEVSSTRLESDLAAFFAQKYLKDTKINVANDTKAMTRLLFRANIAKKSLLSRDQTTIFEANLTKNKDFKLSLQTSDLKDILQSQGEVILRSLEYVISQSSLNKKDIKDLIVIGNEAKSAVLQGFLQEFFKVKLPMHVQDEDVLASGTAIFAANYSREYPKVKTNLMVLTENEVRVKCEGSDKEGFSEEKQVFMEKTVLGTGKNVEMTYGNNVNCEVFYKKNDEKHPLFSAEIRGIENIDQKVEAITLEFEYTVAGVVKLKHVTANSGSLKSDLRVTVADLEVPGGLSQAKIERTAAHIHLFRSQEEANRVRYESLARLNSELKGFKDALNHPDFQKLMGEEPVEKLRKEVKDVEEWMKSVDAASAERYVYVEKIQKVRTAFEEPLARFKAQQALPDALSKAFLQVNSLTSALNTLKTTRNYLSPDEIQSISKQLLDTKAWLDTVKKGEYEGKPQEMVELIALKMKEVSRRIDILQKTRPQTTTEQKKAKPQVIEAKNKMPHGRPKPRAREEL